MKKSWFLTGVYFTFYFIVFLIGFLFTFPTWQHPAELFLAVGTWLIATMFFIISICRNPGYIKAHPNVEFLVSNTGPLQFYSFLFAYRNFSN